MTLWRANGWGHQCWIHERIQLPCCRCFDSRQIWRSCILRAFARHRRRDLGQTSKLSWHWRSFGPGLCSKVDSCTFWSSSSQAISLSAFSSEYGSQDSSVANDWRSHWSLQHHLWVTRDRPDAPKKVPNSIRLRIHPRLYHLEFLLGLTWASRWSPALSCWLLVRIHLLAEDFHSTRLWKPNQFWF